MRTINKISRFIFIIIICVFGSLSLTTQANAADGASCLTSEQPTVANGKFLDHLAAVLLRLRLIRQATYEEIVQGDMRIKKNALRRIFSRPQGRIDEYIKHADAQHSFIEILGKEKRTFLRSVRSRFSDREAGLLFTVARFIFKQKGTDQHYFVLEHAEYKSAYGIKLDKLAYNLAQAINATTAESTILIPNRITVPIVHLESPKIQKWAKKKGLKEVTLIRFVTDYTNEANIQNPTSIESHIAFLLWLRDGDHGFSMHNSYWIKERTTSILYDFDAALRQGSESFDNFWNGNGREIDGQIIECLWKQNLNEQFIIIMDQPNFLLGKVEKRIPYEVDYDALRAYVRVIRSMPDTLIRRCVEDSGFEMIRSDPEEWRSKFGSGITWKGLNIYERLIKQRDSLSDDLDLLIKDLEHDKAQATHQGEVVHLGAA